MTERQMKCMEKFWYNIPKNRRSWKRSFGFYLLRFWAVKICYRALQDKSLQNSLLLLVSFHLLKGRASNSHVSAHINAPKLWDWKPAGPTAYIPRIQVRRTPLVSYSRNLVHNFCAFVWALTCELEALPLSKWKLTRSSNAFLHVRPCRVR